MDGMKLHRLLPALYRRATSPRIALALVSLHLTLFVGACAAQPPEPAAQSLAPSATAAPATATARPATATPAAPTATPQPQVLSVWVAEDEPALSAARTAIEAAAATAGVPVSIAARPPDGVRLSVSTAALVGEPPPDLIWADQEALIGLLADGQLQPVAPELAGDALPALLTAGTQGGELWGAPVAASADLLLLYNRALVSAPPATSDELIVGARAASTPEIAGLVMAWDEARWLLPWIYGFGGAPVSADGETITLDTPETNGALNLLRELYAAGEDETHNFRAAQRLFGQGYAAMAIDGAWNLETYRAMSDTLDLGIAPLPRIPATGRPATPPLGGTYLMFHRELQGEARAQAEALVGALAAPEAQLSLALGLGRLPAQVGLLRDPALGENPALVAAAALAADAPGLPPTLAARCALFGIDIWLPGVLAGSSEPAEAATRMQREGEACVTRAAEP
jgi:arabinogalactan oligomer/maltooligosaccharide transport system substrate-binding protein